MTDRTLLLYNPVDGSQGFKMGMPVAGWRLLEANSPSAARQIVDKYKVRLGIAVLNGSARPSLNSLEEIILHCQRMEWIALVSPSCLTSSPLSAFIAQSFFDYHTLPVDQERLMITLGHAYGKAQLKEKIHTPILIESPYELIGASSAMLAIYREMGKMQNVDSPILIYGESGTGKELVAQAIHRNSRRKDAPFVAVNCGALPAHLIQTELFGHEKGAFTGAIDRKIGRIEAAEGGTIFLDEIGDIPLELQTNLLRFLQEKTIERIGSTQSITIDARVMAATHVNLEEAVEQGLFRSDLYFRLNVLQLNMPPLRERRGDIELLAQSFLDKFSQEKRIRCKHFSQQALRVMNKYSWPGNVREMINRIRRAIVMSEGNLISPSDLGLDQRAAARNLVTLEKARSRAEKEAIQYSLLCNRNNVSQAARQLGVSRVTLYRLMNKFRITLDVPGGSSSLQ